MKSLRIITYFITFSFVFSASAELTTQELCTEFSLVKISKPYDAVAFIKQDFQDTKLSDQQHRYIDSFLARIDFQKLGLYAEVSEHIKDISLKQKFYKENVFIKTDKNNSSKMTNILDEELLLERGPTTIIKMKTMEDFIKISFRYDSSKVIHTEYIDYKNLTNLKKAKSLITDKLIYGIKELNNTGAPYIDEDAPYDLYLKIAEKMDTVCEYDID
jgi:hypothetical protein